jgi:hypothetical protein
LKCTLVSATGGIAIDDRGRDATHRPVVEGSVPRAPSSSPNGESYPGGIGSPSFQFLRCSGSVARSLASSSCGRDEGEARREIARDDEDDWKNRRSRVVGRSAKDDDGAHFELPELRLRRSLRLLERLLLDPQRLLDLLARQRRELFQGREVGLERRTCRGVARALHGVCVCYFKSP